MEPGALQACPPPQSEKPSVLERLQQTNVDTAPFLVHFVIKS
jgi:hypothetical protein